MDLISQHIDRIDSEEQDPQGRGQAGERKEDDQNITHLQEKTVVPHPPPAE